jgi:hypothetical protein
VTFRERLEATIRDTLKQHSAWILADDAYRCECGHYLGPGDTADLIDLNGIYDAHVAAMVVTRLDPQQAGWAYPCLDGYEDHFPWILGAHHEVRPKYEPVFRFGALTDPGDHFANDPAITGQPANITGTFTIQGDTPIAEPPPGAPPEPP